MNIVNQDDPILRRLSNLTTPLPDPARAERTIERCHAVMTRRVRRQQPRRGFGRRMLEPAVLGGFSLAYFVAIVDTLLRWRGVY